MLKWDRIRKEVPERELRNASETHMSNVGTAVALNRDIPRVFHY